MRGRRDEDDERKAAEEVEDGEGDRIPKPRQNSSGKRIRWLFVHFASETRPRLSRPLGRH